MKTFLRILILLILTVLMVGCKSVDPRQFPIKQPRTKINYTAEYLQTNIWHSLRIIPSTNCANITIYNKVNPIWWFRNAGEPETPEWFAQDESFRNIKWFFRNPFNNFTHYVIGVTDKEFISSGLYPERMSDPTGGWYFSVIKYKWIRLPLISYHKGKIDFYFGWSVGGNFGIKFNVKDLSKESPGKIWKDQQKTKE